MKRYLHIGLLLAGCLLASDVRGAEPLHVVVSILPQQYFVDRIAGDLVEVTVMVGPGESPSTYEPRPSQLRALSRAAAYMTIGVPFEDAWLDRMLEMNRGIKLIDTTDGITRLPMQDDAAHGHVHEHDPHTWLSPILVRQQAETICAALCELDVSNASHYKERLSVFVAELDQLDADIRETLASSGASRFMVFHPSWGYFAHDYGLEMVAVETGGQEPSAFELTRLVQHARDLGIRTIFAQPEFSTRSAEILARELEGEVVRISPLAEDWPENMRRFARAIAGEGMTP